MVELAAMGWIHDKGTGEFSRARESLARAAASEHPCVLLAGREPKAIIRACPRCRGLDAGLRLEHLSATVDWGSYSDFEFACAKAKIVPPGK
jgi:hypothetical protein